MSDLTEKQRAALTALRDVMEEHDIDININPEAYSSWSVTISINPDNQPHDLDFFTTGNIDYTDIDKHLTTQE